MWLVCDVWSVVFCVFKGWQTNCSATITLQDKALFSISSIGNSLQRWLVVFTYGSWLLNTKTMIKHFEIITISVELSIRLIYNSFLSLQIFPGFLQNSWNNILCQCSGLMAGFPAGFFSATGQPPGQLKPSPLPDGAVILAGCIEPMSGSAC